MESSNLSMKVMNRWLIPNSITTRPMAARARSI
jgi:hypothetical protein